MYIHFNCRQTGASTDDRVLIQSELFAKGWNNYFALLEVIVLENYSCLISTVT